MWKCPKCGRSFKNGNQSHYCGKAPETVDEYILAQDEGIRSIRIPHARELPLPLIAEIAAWCRDTGNHA